MMLLCLVVLETGKEREKMLNSQQDSKICTIKMLPKNNGEGQRMEFLDFPPRQKLFRLPRHQHLANETCIRLDENDL